jgi:hypothetical protein
MLVGVLKTDGGPHPAETWAQITASQIIDIGSGASDVRLQEAREFENKLVQILTGHHTEVQASERAGLDQEGPARLVTEIDTSDHLDSALGDVIALARGTSFAAHFAKPEVRAYLTRLLHEHFHHSMHIERSWHADANADHEHSIAFKQRATNGIGAFAGNPLSNKEDA